jgi:ketosteroid isomerase-like protein
LSQEKVEIVRRWLDGLAHGELSLGLCDPEMVIENVAEFPITGPYRGHEGVRRWWRDLSEAFSEMRIEVDELIDLGDERVLTTLRIVGRFRRTDIPIDTPWGSLISVKDGKIARAAGYGSRRQAFEAAGMSE